jgi:hypothetical protein
MPEKIFEQKDIKAEQKITLDELTSAELVEMDKPITLSEKTKSILNTKYGILVSNQENKSIRIVGVNSKRIIKLVIYLKSVSKFVTQVLKFYKQYNIDIVYTSGICFRKDPKKAEDCIYESYINLEKCIGLSEVQIIEEIQKIEGVEKIFILTLGEENAC